MKYAVGLIFFLYTSLIAQYIIDVKTRYEEWDDFGLIQDKVEEIIDNSNFAKTHDTGENYSLWLKNYGWLHANDSISIKLSVELCTPSLIFQGDLVNSTDIELKYHWEQMKSHTDSIDLDIFNSSIDNIPDILALLDTIAPLIDIWADDYNIPSGTIIPRVKPFVEIFLRDDQYSYETPVDIYTSYLLAQQIFVETERMIKTTNYKKKSLEEEFDEIRKKTKGL